MPSIDRNSPTPFYQQVYERIARGIEEGTYPPGQKLPSIRECARELGVSNTTIELAYQKLTEEGYVVARRGSGYTICEFSPELKNPVERFTEPYRQALAQLIDSESKRASAPIARYDFAYDAIDEALFPVTTWARMSREVFFNKGAEHACLYNDRQGLPDLRDQIARYVSSEFGIVCTHEQILVMPTTKDLISTLASLFDSARTTFAMEDPGYDEVRRKLTASGYKVISVPAFPDLDWGRVRAAVRGAQVVFTTPVCQFPANRPMPLDIRKNLVSWAEETGALIIDDEYGWEFQSGVARMPPLATLDRSGNVITVGTFSNSFTPAICLSYAILPPQIMLKWQATERSAHPAVPWQTQAAMASFMSEGFWRTHIRKMRTTMARKRDVLLSALKTNFGQEIEIIPGSSSLFVLVKHSDGRSEHELISAAAAHGIAVYPTSRYWHDAVPDEWRYVLIGYAGIAESDIESGIEALAQAWQR